MKDRPCFDAVAEYYNLLPRCFSCRILPFRKSIYLDKKCLNALALRNNARKKEILIYDPERKEL